LPGSPAFAGVDPNREISYHSGMTTPRSPRFDTLSLHAGQRPDPATGARAVPIYQTTSYVFDDTDHAAGLFNLERAGHIYSRISNPTVAVLEERIAALEGGVGAVATASGQAALHLAIATLMGAGGHIVASARIYGGSHNMFTHTLPRFGIATTFADPRDPDSFARAITDRTRLVFAETLGNPGLEVLDIQAVADVAHRQALPLMVDSTFTTPWLCQPVGHGADIVMHSATKFLGGHGIAIGGLLVDGGRFDWAASGKFPTMTEPYAGYHGISFAEEFGPAAFVMRARAEGLRDFGACMSPANAFYLLQGIETLPVRMARHVGNAQAVAEFLKQHDAVAWVKYAGLESHPDFALARRQMPKGAGAIMSFGIKGGRKAGAKLIERLRLFSHLANVGDAKSLVIHPASTTHQQMSAEDLAKAGVGEELVRLSIGLEDTEDLIEDLSQALAASQRG
jgi:O-acetylhomoserine (thiol)-lyase